LIALLYAAGAQVYWGKLKVYISPFGMVLREEHYFTIIG